MGTQATLAIRREGKVIYKIVTGCNGSEMPALARCLEHGFESSPNVTIQELFHLAVLFKVGCASCLVIQTTDQILLSNGYDILDEVDAAVHKRFVDTFNDPKFNPRWEHGTADYSLIVDIPSGTQAEQSLKFVSQSHSDLILNSNCC